MNKHLAILTGLIAASALHAQTTHTGDTAFQYFISGPSEATAGFKMMGIEGIRSSTVTGKPVSGTEERHTLQILGDGTRIENKETNRFFRDNQGRTRIERPDGSVVIQNPADGFFAEMNTNGKTVRRMTFQIGHNTGTGAGTGAGSGAGFGYVTAADPGSLQRGAKAKLDKESAEIALSSAAGGKNVIVQSKVFTFQSGTSEETPGNEQDLGIQSINGVTAQGKRTTMTIPAGKIGNNRPIEVVSERWFSNDLQMLVRSTNSDPRFGETTYEFTNISQAAPDPSLFQIPTDYTSPQVK